METLITKSPLQIKLNNNNVPDETFDGESSNEATDTLKTIADNVTFKNDPLHEKTPEKKKRKLGEAREKRKLEKEKYNAEMMEQKYKLLMHLLSKSKFFSDFIMKKIDEDTKKPVTTNKMKIKGNRKDENSPPEKDKSKKGRPAQKNSLQKYMSPDLERKLRSEKRKLSDEEIGAELASGSDESPMETKSSGDFSDIPKYFNGKLFDYQRKGLHWLKILYENGLNGILADEMGLGKTVQVIALLCHLLEKRQAGPFLIVAPLSTLPNWIMEFEKFAPELPVILLHGPEPERRPIHTKIRHQYPIGTNFKTAPIVITSFDTPMRDQHILRKQRWRYIIVDEAQRIKNHECYLIKVLHTFPSLNRLLLTGTPLQNSLSELWSLLNFLLPVIFDDLSAFKSWFDVSEMQQTDGAQKILKQEEEKSVISTLREILKPFMLRREKSDVDLQISRKKELVVYAPLTQLQYDLYKAIIHRDYEMLSKVQEDPVILVDQNGKRPRRKCTFNHAYSQRASDTESDSSSIDLNQDTSNDSVDSETWKNIKMANPGSINMWKQYTNISERNYEFFIRMSSGSRGVLYKKVVNHPYLVHCPLGSDGLPKVDEDLIKASGKLLVLDAMLAKLKQRGHKVLLFSTMTMILDIIEDFLSMRTFNYVRLDGQTSIEDRTANIKVFNEDPNMFLFLISTRAGGVGLNLLGADTVIIYDSDWNPQVDIQAMARCHRIGQTRPVVVYRFCTRGTIDERIITRANAKRVLEKAVISKAGNRVNLNSKEILLELKNLLESKDYEHVTSKSDVFTEEELNKLLDRSDLMTSSGDAA